MSSLALNIALVAIITISSVVCFPQLNDPVVVKCDNSHCTEPKADKLNVHLIPHSHDDVGWRKTVDQYYWGSNSQYAKAGVQYVLDSVIETLLQNDKRKFIYVETAFFWMWWTKQDQKIRDVVKDLVNNGMNLYIFNDKYNSY